MVLALVDVVALDGVALGRKVLEGIPVAALSGGVGGGLQRGDLRFEQGGGVGVAASGAGPEFAVARNTALGWGIHHLNEDFAPLEPPAAADAKAQTLLARESAPEAPRLPLVPAEDARRAGTGYAPGASIAPLAVAANAGSPLKVPDPQTVAEAIDRLLAQAGEQPVLLFTGPEPAPAEALSAALDERGVPHRLLPPIDLNVTAAVLRRCALLLCPDSGLMHLAAAVRCPTVGLFGPTSQRFYQPRINRSAAAAPTPEQEPCPERFPDRMGPPNCNIERRCYRGHRSCIDLLTADQILDAALPLLAPEPAHA